MNFIEYNKNYRPKLNQAVIFVGGKGLRLGNLTKKTPKPLLKIKKNIFRYLNPKLIKIWNKKNFITL